MREPPQMPPKKIVERAQIVRLPLWPDLIADIQRRAAQRGRPLGALELAHELGDVRFAAAFAPNSQTRPRWQGALSVFSFVTGSRPALVGHTTHTLDTLRAVPPPATWPGDPILWDQAEAAPLLSRLERRRGLLVPFSAEFWPGHRVTDPAKAPQGKRRTPRMRDVDIARHVQATQPHLERPAAYAFWLVTQLPGAQLNPLEARLMAEVTAPAAPGSFQVVSIRLTGRLQVDDPQTLG
jgi:hypothetical protein